LREIGDATLQTVNSVSFGRWIVSQTCVGAASVALERLRRISK
jgi:hypothetical protein